MTEMFKDTKFTLEQVFLQSKHTNIFLEEVLNLPTIMPIHQVLVDRSYAIGIILQKVLFDPPHINILIVCETYQGMRSFEDSFNAMLSVALQQYHEPYDKVFSQMVHFASKQHPQDITQKVRGRTFNYFFMYPRFHRDHNVIGAIAHLMPHASQIYVVD